MEKLAIFYLEKKNLYVESDIEARLERHYN